MSNLNIHDRAAIIEELSSHIRTIETGASPIAETPVFRDTHTEEKVVAHCRWAMNLISHRMRSESELMRTLSEREIDPEIVAEVLNRLSRAKLIDDHEFAVQWITQRRKGKLLGTAALRAELEGKGIAEAIINSALDLSEDTSEKERCQALVRAKISHELRKAGGSAHKVNRGAALRRIGNAAARRGYSRNLTLHVVNHELDAAGITWS